MGGGGVQKHPKNSDIINGCPQIGNEWKALLSKIPHFQTRNFEMEVTVASFLCWYTFIDNKYLDNHRQKVDGELRVNDLRTFLKSI